MKKNLLLLLTIMLLVGCKKEKAIEPINSQRISSTVIKSYSFIGQLQIVYDYNTQQYSSVSYSYPQDYNWGYDSLLFNSDNTFSGGFGSGDYSYNLDTCNINASNWVGTNNSANLVVHKAIIMPITAIKALYLDTTINASIIDTGNVFVVYITGSQSGVNNKIVRMSLFR